MDIAALSMSMAQAELVSSVNIAVMKQAMDMTKQAGEMISELAESCTIDIKV